MATSATPYLDIAKAYETQYRQNLANQEAQLAQQLATSKNASNRQYESAANANYINYMKQKNALPEQLAAQHINGGASETANVNMMNNYALNRGNTEASRIAALGQLQSTYDTNIANMRSAANDAILNNKLALQQSQVQYEDTLAQRQKEEARYNKEYKDQQNAKLLEQYAATISRFTTEKSIDKAIDNLKKKKPANYKQMIWLLQQRKAELNKSSGGGGGSSSGGGRGYSSGGGSSSSSTSSSSSSSSGQKSKYGGVNSTTTKNTNKIRQRYAGVQS